MKPKLYFNTNQLIKQRTRVAILILTGSVYGGLKAVAWIDVTTKNYTYE